MQTNFSDVQLATAGMRENERILRSCVHCGFCSATCPTYALLGDELDSPRGRIYLIKNMFETGRAATARDALHIDRCLSCLSCMTTCPSGVDYMHLVDSARAWIEKTYVRPWPERVLRAVLAFVLPYRKRFGVALALGRMARPFVNVLPEQLRAMLRLMPERAEQRVESGRAIGVKRMRVALLGGCVQPVLAPQVDAATVRLLTRLGCEVVTGGGCCGALTYHLGKDGRDFARANIDRWMAEIGSAGLDAIVVNASGCGVMMKDYWHLLADDPAYADSARRIAGLAKDPCEVIESLGLVSHRLSQPIKVAYHAACSLQHGQQIRETPKALLRQAGFEVLDVPEGHMCCGSAGTYNILQPRIAGQLRDAKAGNIRKIAPDVVAAGNIGCLMQIAHGTPEIAVVHTVELLDWATGGPMPGAMARKGAFARYAE